MTRQCLLFFLAAAPACANGSVKDDAGDPIIDASANDVVTLPLDSGSDATFDAPIDVFDAGCTPDAALAGIGLPAGSTASATSSYDVDTPNLAVDNDTSTYWNAGGVAGSLTITLSDPRTFDAVRIAVVALPTSDETYTIYGFQDANPPFQIGQSTQSAPEGGGTLAPIPVTEDTYNAIRIDVTSTGSWVAISEVGLVTKFCP